MESFKRQLQHTEKDAEETSCLYPDLSPEGKRECREHVEKTIETLSKIKKSLEDADPDVKTLQLAGYHHYPGLEVHVSRQIMCYVKGWQGPGHHNDKPEIVIEKIWIEDNFVHGESFKLHQIKECFIKFNTPDSADFVLGLQIPFSSDRTKLSKPKQNAATRATYRKIGSLVTRIREIEEELKKLGAVRECGRPIPHSNFGDRSYFAEQVPKWKRALEAGTMLDHHAYAPLKHFKMVDRQRLQSRMDTLFNEECDALIKLREFQLSGYEFDF
jgi:hypothetical protein